MRRQQGGVGSPSGILKARVDDAMKSAKRGLSSSTKSSLKDRPASFSSVRIKCCKHSLSCATLKARRGRDFLVSPLLRKEENAFSNPFTRWCQHRTSSPPCGCPRGLHHHKRPEEPCGSPRPRTRHRSFQGSHRCDCAAPGLWKSSWQ